MKELLLTFLFALVVGSIINGFTQAPPSTDPMDAHGEGVTLETDGIGGEGATPLASNVSDTSDSRFANDVLQSPVPVLVDFWAEWCGPCKVMLPIIDSLATEYQGKLKVVRLNVDNNEQTSSKYKIREIPTFMFFKDGRKVESVTGAVGKERLKQVVERVL